MMRRAFALILLLAGTQAQAADFGGEARDAVAALVSTVHAALTDAALTPEARDAAVRDAAAEAFALDLWRRAVIGGEDAGFTPAQSAAIDAALPGWLAGLYVERFAGAGRKPEVGGVAPARRDVLVDVTMFRPRGEPLPLDYRVREVDGAPKVLDVIIGGVSFALLKREEFRAILERGGPEALIAHLQAGAL